MIIYNDKISETEKRKLEDENIKVKIELLSNYTLSLIKKKKEIQKEVDSILDHFSALCFTKDTMIVAPPFPFFDNSGENYGIIRGKDFELSFCALGKETVNLNQFNSPDISSYLLSDEIDQITKEIQKLTVKFVNFLNMIKEEEKNNINGSI